MDGNEGEERLEAPTVTMILKSRQATKSVMTLIILDKNDDSITKIPKTKSVKMAPK